MEEQQLLAEGVREAIAHESIEAKLQSTGDLQELSSALEAELLRSAEIGALVSNTNLSELRHAESAWEDARRSAIERLAAEDPEVRQARIEMQTLSQELSEQVDELRGREAIERGQI